MKYLLAFFISMFLLCCNSKNINGNYSKIEYEAGACFGSCPIFKITINPDRTAIFEAEHFNFSKGFSKEEFSKNREGTFKTTINESDYNKLIALLNDLNPKGLQNKYGNFDITDLPTSYLRIKYKDGTSKETEDYGKNGNKKLTGIYKFFEELRYNQKWVKVN